jgi:hypothetical protein
MERSFMSRGYLLARGYVFACGIVLILSMYASQVVMPGLYYDAGPTPAWPDRAIGTVGGLAYALLLVLPYRWSTRGWAFRVRLTLLVLASFWLAFAAASGIYGFIEGGKDWLIVPASVLIFALAILAPGALLARRKMDWQQKQVSGTFS